MNMASPPMRGMILSCTFRLLGWSTAPILIAILFTIGL
ncbi:Teichoic acid linkage unit synthesis [Bacillus subtilis subsp. subtilis]|nr:Teichoic acid linkage unit synthesis [Bacillus subtilis subsp. subtilis]